MIQDRGLVRARRLDGTNWRANPLTRQMMEKAIVDGCGDKLEDWEFRHAPSCLVCGDAGRGETNRCHSHRAASPCGVDGCTKGRKFSEGVFDEPLWVCGIHWKLVCPPRSTLRRTYLRFFRTARRLGCQKSQWPRELEVRYFVFMRGLIRRFNRKVAADEFLNVDEIHKMFGWTDD